ncbi:unnamed protein product [Schistocephalus solidus]|uniref:DUF7041 domain-containing protein n=1 Tax=Schistocephalus solidus TaxID=70667 RepID=A0A183SPE6_SCHSO|nr:unnamed protein product [Schistocephalus solidus]
MAIQTNHLALVHKLDYHKTSRDRSEDDNSSIVPCTWNVSIKLPAFWPLNVEVWITLWEAEFEACNIARQETIFNQLRRCLPDKYAEELGDLSIHRPPEQPYEKSKDALAKRIGTTEEHCRRA